MAQEMLEGFVARHGFWAPEFVSRPGALVQPDLRQSLEAPRHVHVTFLLVRLDQGSSQYSLTKARIAAERTGDAFWQSPARLVHLIVPKMKKSVRLRDDGDRKSTRLK